jgi:diguanylate cyclase (GGDEF)-like protein
MPVKKAFSLTVLPPVLFLLLSLFAALPAQAQDLLLKWTSGSSLKGLPWAVPASLGVLAVLGLQQLWIGGRQRDTLSLRFVALMALHMLWCGAVFVQTDSGLFSPTGLVTYGAVGVVLSLMALTFLTNPAPLPWLRAQLLPVGLTYVAVALLGALGLVQTAQILALLVSVAMLVVLVRASLYQSEEAAQALVWFVVASIPWLLACVGQVSYELGWQTLIWLRPVHCLYVVCFFALGQSLALLARQHATLRTQLATQTRLLATIQTREQQLQQQLHDRLDDLRRHQRQLDEQAYLDTLTELPNRRLFGDRFALAAAQARRSGKTFALAVLDLDHFSKVNEQRGQAMGDALLQEVSRRIGQSLRSTDTLARLGGDEFGLILHDSEDRDAVALVCTRILNSVRGDLICMGYPLQISLSMGVAFFQTDGATLESLYNAAEGAMRSVKRKGRNGFQWAS